MPKKALITGATGKIGREVCLELARAGYDIALHYHAHEQEAQALAAQIAAQGHKVNIYGADLSHADECVELVKRVEEIDVFIHCASTFERTPFGEVTASKFDEVIAVEMRPAFLLGQTIGIRMRERGFGHIVFFSDIAAEQPYGNYLPYCMAKAGIDVLAKGLSKELGSAVQVNVIAPGAKADPGEMARKVLEVLCIQ